ncbi:ubiquinol-cytochrome C reductase cytochrome C subunit [Longimycelium tulufanense]|uniref:Cytochrome bc1 complex cytochrome c subunit n=1 Tax=Longimycelium tulufanense TaxID=907463 RepID=A0A8J3CFQ1_9PSEU|nr:c-type cytochrome [Longimycelium tulufanense]GGM53860.1 ubiquinol-cytochrome C reductase cytochrome C subunit [Longimycelium tulufanense]
MTTKKQRTRQRSKLRRRVAGLLALSIALLSVGGLYVVLTPKPQMANAAEDPALVRQGEQLYNTSCITCHGSNLQGEQDRGPSLIGVGEAAVYFQVSTGRMPMARQEAQAVRKPPKFSPEQIDALAAFVQSRGGGPVRPEERGEALRGSDPARGGELFRLNCASCHNFTGRGGALSSGKFAPELDGVTEEQLYTAMLTGPQNMPKFSDRQLSPEEKKDIIAYVKSVTEGRNNPGGNALGGYGPGPEGVIAWIVGIGALIGVTLWIGSKA